MADFGDFIAGFTGQLLTDRTAADNRKNENDEWERRQRLLKQLDVETTKEKNSLERKDGNTFQDESGAWVTEQLDGGGNVVGTRAATAAERAKTEATVLDTDMKRDEFEYRDTDRSLDRRYKESLINESGERVRASRERRAREAAGLTEDTANPEAVIDTWLNSNEGKMAVNSYMGTMGRTSGTIRGGAMDNYEDITEEEQQYVAYQQLRQEIISNVQAMEPSQRPKTEAEFRALISQIANKSRQSLDRYTKPVK